MSPMSRESHDHRSADELLVQILGLYDEIYQCRLALHESMSDVCPMSSPLKVYPRTDSEQGHFSISRARYDLSSNSRIAISSADYNMGMKASKKMCVAFALPCH